MDERRGPAVVGQARGDPDLPVRRREEALQAELAQGAWHAQDEQGLGFRWPQAAKREAVARDELAAAAGSRFGEDRHPGDAERRQVPVDRPDRDLELLSQGLGGRPSPGLEQQDQGHQPVGAHHSRLDRFADMRCQQ